MTTRYSLGCAAILSFLLLAGCESKPATTPTAGSGAAASGDGHDHGEHGPHGGHMLHLDPDGVHAEWTHDDDTKTITVFLDELTTPPSEVKIVVTAGATEPQTFALTKEGTDAAGWTITSDALMTHLNMQEAAQVKLVVVADKELSAKIEHSDEHHHH